MADNTNLTPIEQKKISPDATDTGKQNKWGPFGMTILLSMLITVFVGISGANLIYLTNAVNSKDATGVSLLETFLPTRESVYFPQNKTMAGGSASCSATKEYVTNWSLLNNIGIGTTGGFPYNFYNKDDRFSLIQQFINWMVVSVADTYVNNRWLLQKWLSLFARDTADKNKFANETFQMFIVAPVMLLIFPLILLCIHISSWFSTFKAGWGFTFVGLFLSYSFLLTSSVSIIQSLQYLFLLLILPLVADFKKIKKIISCNVNALSFLFGILLCSSALIYLDTTISVTMFISFLLWTYKLF